MKVETFLKDKESLIGEKGFFLGNTTFSEKGDLRLLFWAEAAHISLSLGGFTAASEAPRGTKGNHPQ